VVNCEYFQYHNNFYLSTFKASYTVDLYKGLYDTHRDVVLYTVNNSIGFKVWINSGTIKC